MDPLTITLFEHQPRAYADLGLDSQPKARERILAGVERINALAGEEILHLGRKELHANALVGVVRAGEVTFEILPKIDWEPSGGGDISGGSSSNARGRLPSPQYSAARNLLSMLAYAYHLRIHEQDIASLNAQASSWFELLTRLFASGLHRQILSGFSQHYIVREETLPVLRGRWDVQRQILRRASPLPSFEVSYDDLSVDIPLNQVLRLVVEKLYFITNDPENRALLGKLNEWFRPVTRLAEVSPDFLNSIHFNRLNERFLPAYNLARLFLSGSVLQATSGGWPTYAFVLDMNTLFERFVAGLLERHRAEVLPPGYRDLAVVPQSEGMRLYLARASGQNVLRLRPDLLLMRKGQAAPVLVADTKYKRLHPSQRSLGLDPADIYQVLAYTTRLQCGRGLLLYPLTTSSKPTRKTFEIEPGGPLITAATINLCTPLQPPHSLLEELRAIFQTVF